MAGSNRALVAAFVDQRQGVVIAQCAIDNLLKGAAGQAIQAANIMFGLDESGRPADSRVDAMSVTAPGGFLRAGTAAGIKASGGLDLAIVIAADGAGSCCRCLYPQPGRRRSGDPLAVSVSRRVMARAVVLNSGSANAGTGASGMTRCRKGHRARRGTRWR